MSKGLSGVQYCLLYGMQERGPGKGGRWDWPTEVRAGPRAREVPGGPLLVSLNHGRLGPGSRGFKGRREGREGEGRS